MTEPDMPALAEESDDEENLPAEHARSGRLPTGSHRPSRSDTTPRTVEFESDKTEDTIPYDTDTDLEDLIVFEDMWSCLTDDHKMLPQTGSFTIGRDMYDKPIDVKQVETPQSVLHVLHDQSRRDGKYRRRNTTQKRFTPTTTTIFT